MPASLYLDVSKQLVWGGSITVNASNSTLRVAQEWSREISEFGLYRGLNVKRY